MRLYSFEMAILVLRSSKLTQFSVRFSRSTKFVLVILIIYIWLVRADTPLVDYSVDEFLSFPDFFALRGHVVILYLIRHTRRPPLETWLVHPVSSQLRFRLAGLHPAFFYDFGRRVFCLEAFETLLDGVVWVRLFMVDGTVSLIISVKSRRHWPFVLNWLRTGDPRQFKRLSTFFNPRPKREIGLLRAFWRQRKRVRVFGLLLNVSEVDYPFKRYDLVHVVDTDLEILKFRKAVD